VYLAKEANYADWESYFKKCHKANMLQCWQYGNAKEQTSRWSAIRFIVFNEKKDVVGLTQALYIQIPILGGIVRVNRGPILMENIPTKDIKRETINIISALLDEFQKRRWRVTQIAPEIVDSNHDEIHLKWLGLTKLANNPYGSGMINLLVEESFLLSSLKKKWRYYLRKGQKIGFKTEIIKGNSDQVELLLKKYEELQKDKNFSGICTALVSALASQDGDEWGFTLLVAKDNEYVNSEPLGMLVSVRHGDVSTYLIALTNKKGRDYQVNYVLLWRAMLNAKEEGSTWFDIGGMDSSTPKGIKHFKSGLNADLYSLSGEWRGVLYPWKSYKKILKK